MSDSLENGAGYSTHLGTPDEFEKLLQFILGVAGPAWSAFLDPSLAIHVTENA